MTGKILFYNNEKKFGMISDNDNITYIFFRSNFLNDPYELPLAKKEEIVQFEPAEGKDNKKIATNIFREEWKKGIVDSFSNDKGYGFIRDINSDTTYFCHYSNIISDTKIKRFYEGDYVAYKLGLDPIRNKTNVIECFAIDNRTLFDRYFFFENLDSAINELSKMASKEEDKDWNFTHEESSFSHPVLYNYTRQTLLRLIEQDKEQDKILDIIRNDKNIYLFNTGLNTDYGEGIFAYFENDPQNKVKYVFKSFLEDSSNVLLDLFGSKRPGLATYLDDPIDFIYDYRLKLIPDTKHILEHNIDRLPADLKTKSKTALGQQLMDRIKVAEKKVKRNYRLAIPQFYQGSVQLLLPLCLSSSDEVDRALVVERKATGHGEFVYRANTILTLSQAYNNARLICPQDRAWLEP